MKTYPNTKAILTAVAKGDAPAGYVISTTASWLANEQWHDKLVFLPANEVHDRFPISAACSKSDGDLKDAIDLAWDALHRSGKLARVFARWHVPYESSQQPHSTRGTGP